MSLSRIGCDCKYLRIQGSFNHHLGIFLLNSLKFLLLIYCQLSFSPSPLTWIRQLEHDPLNSCELSALWWDARAASRFRFCCKSPHVLCLCIEGMEIRGDLLSYLHIKCGGKPFCTSLEAFTKDAVSEQALGDLGIRRESRMATERLFQPINRIQGNYYVPVEEAASCQIYCQWGPDSERHIYAREHTCMSAHTHTHTASTHAWLRSYTSRGNLASESSDFFHSSSSF